MPSLMRTQVLVLTQAWGRAKARLQLFYLTLKIQIHESIQTLFQHGGFEQRRSFTEDYKTRPGKSDLFQPGGAWWRWCVQTELRSLEAKYHQQYHQRYARDCDGVLLPSGWQRRSRCGEFAGDVRYPNQHGRHNLFERGFHGRGGSELGGMSNLSLRIREASMGADSALLQVLATKIESQLTLWHEEEQQRFSNRCEKNMGWANLPKSDAQWDLGEMVGEG